MDIHTAEEQHMAKRPWDTCREVPVIQDEQTPWKLVKLLKLLSLFIVSLLVFGLAICSKTSFLLLITLSSNATQTVPADQKPVALLSVGCALIAPSVLLLIKSLWKALFKSCKAPAYATLAIVLFIEFLVALGSAVLTIVAMPFFDIVTNVMLLNSIAVLSAVFQIAAQCSAKEMNRFLLPSVFSLILIMVGYILFFLSYLMDEKTRGEMTLWAGLAVAGTVLVSFSWWENYCSLFRSNSFLRRLSEDMTLSQNMLHISSSLLRILVTAAVLGAYIPLSNRDWTSLTNVPADVKKVVTGLVGVQLISSVLCHWFVVAACKMHALRRSFIAPIYLASLGVLALFIGPVIIYFQNYSGPRAAGNYTFTEYCGEAAYGRYQDLEGGMFQRLVLDVTHTLCLRDLSQMIQIGFLGGSALAWWLGLLLATLHICSLKLPRIQRTQDLFVRRTYEGAFMEQSVLLNIRFEIQRGKKVKQPKPVTVTVYLCATMWHETYDEMMKIIISMFRLDKYRPKKDEQAKDVNFESHIYFDDGFQDVRGSSERHVNEYAETLVQVIKEVYKTFMDDDDADPFRAHHSIPEQKILRTPYGGRLDITLPHGNTLMVHFKDKQLIRHKKRWSQIMYLYYLLGWKLTTKYYRMFEKSENDKELEQLKLQLEKEKHNTYLLALDGDTDFQPSAVMLLIDRLKLYPHVGAACGRIHPTGTGPMVWYQKFEYAVGHWLQKTAEHVFGCVLCSPGCFSLFRAEALMDNNVMKRYTTKATEAGHYVQYDQGEDRWLCTLLLQQGWRVEYNAASDAYTNAPQDFKEFYNQRRRWGPSTMANTMDLLGSGTMTSKRNKSISKPYIIYQIVSMATSILGPATICLLIAGSFTFVFSIDPKGALVLAVVIPAIYLFLCFKLKSDTQITVAAGLSVFYAFLMLGTTLSIIGSIVTDKTIFTPSGLFLICMVLIYLITGLMHPQEAHLLVYGFLYILCIPSAYLLLTIYSMANMNNVSWGTRETAPAGGTPKPTTPPQTTAQRAKTTITQLLLQAKGCKCPCWMPSREVSVSQESLVSQEVAPVSLPLPQNTIVEDVESLTYEERQEESTPPPDEQSWVSQLQNMSKELPLSEQPLDSDEVEFWRELQRLYLEPLAEDKEKQRRITNDLKELRNKVNFVFFISNALWLVATFSLQLIGTSVTIPIPKVNVTLDPTGEVIYVDPIGFMFLLGFGSLIVIQFLAMFYHRLYTLIHYVAFEDTEAKAKKLQIRQSNSANDSKILDSGSDEEYDEDYDDADLYVTASDGGTMV